MYGNMNEARWHLNQHLRSSYFIFTPFRLQKSAKNLTKLKLTYLIDKRHFKTINFNQNANRQLFPVVIFKKCYFVAKIFNRNADFSTEIEQIVKSSKNRISTGLCPSRNCILLVLWEALSATLQNKFSNCHFWVLQQYLLNFTV